MGGTYRSYGSPATGPEYIIMNCAQQAAQAENKSKIDVAMEAAAKKTYALFGIKDSTNLVPGNQRWHMVQSARQQAADEVMEAYSAENPIVWTGTRTKVQDPDNVVDYPKDDADRPWSKDKRRDCALRIAYNRVIEKHKKQSPQSPNIFGMAKTYLGVDPMGMRTETEMKLAKDLNDVKFVAQMCEPLAREALGKLLAVDILETLRENQETSDWFFKVWMLREMAKAAPPEHNEFSAEMNQEADRMEEEAKEKLEAVRKAVTFVEALKRITRLAPEELTKEQKDLCKEYGVDLTHLTNIVTAEATGLANFDNRYMLPRETLEIEIPDAENVLLLDAMAAPINQTKPLEEISIADVGAEYERSCIEAAVTKLQKEYLPKAEQLSKQRIEFYVDGKSITLLEKNENEENPTGDNHEAGDKRGEDSEKKRIELVTNALMSGKKVEVHQLSSRATSNVDGQQPEDEKDHYVVQVVLKREKRSAFEQHKKYRESLTEEELAVIEKTDIREKEKTHEAIALARARKALKDNPYAGISGLHTQFVGVNSYGKLSRVEMGFAQQIEKIMLVLPLCSDEIRNLVMDIVESDGFQSLIKQVGEVGREIREMRVGAKLCEDRVASKRMEHKADEMERNALNNDAVWDLNRILSLVEKKVSLQPGKENSQEILACTNNIPSLLGYFERLTGIGGEEENNSDNSVTGMNVGYDIPKAIKIHQPDMVSNLAQEAMALPENVNKPWREIVAAVAQNGNHNEQCYHKMVVENALDTIFRVLGNNRETTNIKDRGDRILIGGMSVKKLYDAASEVVMLERNEAGALDTVAGFKAFDEMSDKERNETITADVTAALLKGKKVRILVNGPDGKPVQIPVQYVPVPEKRNEIQLTPEEEKMVEDAWKKAKAHKCVKTGMRWKNGELRISHPVQGAFAQIAADHSKKDKEKRSAAHIRRLAEENPGVDITGRRSRVEVSAVRSINRLKMGVALCTPETREMVRQGINGKEFKDLLDAMKSYSRQIGQTRDLAEHCMDPSTRKGLTNLANRMERHATKDNEQIRKLFEVLARLEKQVCRERVAPEEIKLKIPPVEQIMSLKNPAKEGADKDVIALQYVYRGVGAVVRDALDVYFSSMEAGQNTRTPEGINRGTQLIVSDKSIEEWMKAEYKGDPGQYGEWYNRKLNTRCVKLATYALVSGLTVAIKVDGKVVPIKLNADELKKLRDALAERQVGATKSEQKNEQKNEEIVIVESGLMKSEQLPQSAPQAESKEIPQSAPLAENQEIPQSAPLAESQEIPQSTSPAENQEIPQSASPAENQEISRSASPVEGPGTSNALVCVDNQLTAENNAEVIETQTRYEIQSIFNELRVKDVTTKFSYEKDGENVAVGLDVNTPKGTGYFQAEKIEDNISATAGVKTENNQLDTMVNYNQTTGTAVAGIQARCGKYFFAAGTITAKAKQVEKPKQGGTSAEDPKQGGTSAGNTKKSLFGFGH